ncbi:MAG TPA: MFS transporter [Stellaceae bacterium]|jgi:Na+/melibiose symporter-like transporter|nr:MFS transporter [Stellaceae bacterium]
MALGARRAIPLVAYGAPAMSVMILSLAPTIYLPNFYVQEKGLPLGAVGLAFLAARAWDAVVDPLLGSLSDRTHSRFGRRKIWLVVTSIILLGLTVLVFMPWFPVGLPFLVVGIIAWYTAFSAFWIPYLAWGPEIASGYQERNVIIGLREAIALLGFFLASALMLVATKAAQPSLGATLQVFTYTLLVLMPVTVAGAAFFAPEPPQPEMAPAKGGIEEWRGAIRAFRRNGPFLRFIAAFFLLQLGLGVWNTVLPLFIGKALLLPGKLNLMIFATFAIAAIAVPGAIWLAGRAGKHIVLCGGQCLYIAALAVLFFVPADNFALVLPLLLPIGLGFCTMTVLPSSIVADTVDYYEFKHAEWRCGLHMAGLIFIGKLAFACSTALAFGLLALAGFNANGPNDSGRLMFLRIVALVIPGLLMAAGAALLIGFPITRRRQAAIRRRLESRRLDPAHPAVA